MDVEWGSLSPYVKGVLLGGVIGAALFLIASFLLHPGFPGDVTWSPHMMTMVKVGALVGAVKGTYKGAKRIVIGLWEVATFYAPMNNYYQPYIEPEVVMMEHLH
ncbi:hypothetical protein IIC65_05295 [Candidatus Sumerlaeota bacterium]|nr:hypothetical protein [Candidatus Sumerlaeota bacterium]